MAEHTEGDPDAYTPIELMTDLRHGVFEEFSSSFPIVDVYRRGLQRVYVDHLVSVLTPPEPSDNSNIPPQFRRGGGGSGDSDLPALARAELIAIKALLEQYRADADGMLAAHIDELIARIDKALKPEK